jgi:hypothetical protein
MTAFAQQKNFEGIIVYRQIVKSKLPGVGDEAFKNYLLTGDSVVVYIKNGNYKHNSVVTKSKI